MKFSSSASALSNPTDSRKRIGTDGRRVAGTNYRRDLDGLRGVAIALVVGFHVWFGRVSGGVDVFLVLSGFFFTGMLLRKGRNVRRFRAWVVWPDGLCGDCCPPSPSSSRRSPRRPSRYARDPVARNRGADRRVGLGFQNWYLARAGGLSRRRSGRKPVATPVVDLDPGPVLRRDIRDRRGTFWLVQTGSTRLPWRPTLIGCWSVCAVASFSFAASQPGQQQALDVLRQRRPSVGVIGRRAAGSVVPMVNPSTFVRALLATTGLLALVSCGAVLDGANRFPGPVALWPVGAAAF